MTAQLTLPVSRFDGAAFDNFFVARNNHDAVRVVRSVAMGSSEDRAVYICGSSGTGKTHLCWAACRLGSETGLRTTYIPLKKSGVSASIVESMSTSSSHSAPGEGRSELVCLDDVDAVIGQPRWDRRLFSLLEHRFISGNIRLMVTATQPANELICTLSDLQSRLQLLSSFRIESLNDEEKAGTLLARAERRGLAVDPEVVEYMLNRLTRDTHALFEFLDRLDTDSLSLKRRITIPFVRSVLERSDYERNPIE